MGKIDPAAATYWLCLDNSVEVNLFRFDVKCSTGTHSFSCDQAGIIMCNFIGVGVCFYENVLLFNIVWSSLGVAGSLNSWLIVDGGVVARLNWIERLGLAIYKRFEDFPWMT